MNKHFIREDIEMLNKHMKMCSTHSIIRKCKLKLHRYHYRPTRRLQNTKCWQVMKSKQNSHTVVVGSVLGIILPRKNICKFLKTKLTAILWVRNPTLKYLPRKWKLVPIKRQIQMFIAAYYNSQNLETT